MSPKVRDKSKILKLFQCLVDVLFLDTRFSIHQIMGISKKKREFTMLCTRSATSDFIKCNGRFLFKNDDLSVIRLAKSLQNFKYKPLTYNGLSR